VLRYVTHYRVPFLEHLRGELDRRGIELVLVAGAPDPGDAGDSKEHTAEVPWAHRIDNRWIRLGGTRLLWQPAFSLLRPGDLVIVDQASSRLLNYALFLRQLRGRQRLALWGHGRNFQQQGASRVGEAVKRFLSRRAHWWFAYNRLSAEVVRTLGYPADRITDVQNAIDTRELIRARAALTPEEVTAVRQELGLPDRHVGVYVGGMYPEKRLDFLIAAAERIRERVPDFSLILIGAGQDAHLAERAADAHPWVHYLGPRLGTEKVPFVAAADLLLMPGLVGLAILDSFALDAPIVTTADADHSPEIDYLEDGANGVLLGAGTTAHEYADEVTRLLLDRDALTALRRGCRESADRYTIEEMATRFADGIEAALKAPPIGARR
jgi:glycosyltransferase involved in cell wall biosynthesis